MGGIDFYLHISFRRVTIDEEIGCGTQTMSRVWLRA